MKSRLASKRTCPIQFRLMEAKVVISLSLMLGRE
jgi:hypothetical protein